MANFKLVPFEDKFATCDRLLDSTLQVKRKFTAKLSEKTCPKEQTTASVLKILLLEVCELRPNRPSNTMRLWHFRALGVA